MGSPTLAKPKTPQDAGEKKNSPYPNNYFLHLAKPITSGTPKQHSAEAQSTVAAAEWALRNSNGTDKKAYKDKCENAITDGVSTSQAGSILSLPRYS